ncbi:tyrosine-type recombinase/integrase [Magnetovirga frankeli]|uniref:tyrosine-type recombinase/integrase n=1 Tax=Magnetovirga frankeli TaxID=947516 RepID=UPI0012935F44|nr:tyrosine-type recombinase/integrase [gamma proteobacterium SS-5]
MAVQKFSKAFVAKVVHGKEPGGPWTDSESPLRLRRTEGGASYSVVKKVAGKAQTFTPRDAAGQALENSASILTLEQARAWANEIVASLTLGHTPQAEKLRKQATFNDLADEYLTNYASTHASTATRAEAHGIACAAVILGDLPLASINHEHAMAMKSHYSNSPANLRKAWGSAKRLLDLAAEKGTITINTFAALKAPKPPQAKKRYPKLQELGAIWQAAMESKGTTGADIHRFAMALPLRAGTITSLTWGEVDLEAGELNLHAQDGRKFSDDQRLPLPPLAMQILKERLPEKPKPQALVFTDKEALAEQKPFAAWNGTVTRLRKRSGVENWSIHDFRRSCVSLVAEMRPDISEDALDRLLTHKAASTNSGVKAVYQRAQGFAGMKQAADAWDQILTAAIGGNVVQLRRAG